MTTFRPAPVALYVDWARLYVAAGGHFTHHYDYPYDRARFLVATRDFTTGGECGANSRTILVPSGIRHLGGELGHNDLYFFDRPAGARGVPTYSDAEFLSLPGIVEHIALEKQHDAAWRANVARLETEAAEAMRSSDLGQHVLASRSIRGGSDG